MRAPPPRPARLAPLTIERLDRLFSEPERSEAEKVLVYECGQNLPFCEDYHPEDLDRFRIAALRLSGGSVDRLRDAVELAKTDWRDLLMAAGFGYDTRAHLSWMPDETGA